ncbi:universal stress protein [Natronolimnohabitans sp. A-GB9]|uniref:universal stress protein n=1 Tax=Natronolimnohabitans sp. A-GB9 TaxID=3069757 RepID=UPI0027B027BF|nr:universal stress protein [Natronolimnohabitans sp. A-GB9]MDQ2050706.1 universal stress protein [Natronolimnohabitans sp. A-GB9]
MFDRILVPTDGSGPANAALEYAGEIAAREQITVHVLYVTDPDEDSAVASEQLAESREWAGDDTAPIIDDVETGDPQSAILDYATDNDVDAIVMGTRGRQGVGRLLLGSTTESVVREAPVPVLVVRGAAEVRRRYPLETILVPTDGSPHAEAALEQAAVVGRHHDATVHLLSVVDVSPAALDERDDLRLERLETHAEDVVDEGVATVEEMGADATGAVKHGSTHRVIRSAADDVGADLLVMGTHGRSGLDRLLLGSVTERVLRRAPAPVLTVRQRD